MPKPEAAAREEIDKALELAGWIVQDENKANVSAGPGVAVREFPLGRFGFADYLLYVNGKAAGVIKAKPTGPPLTGVETQTDCHSQGLNGHLPRPAHRRASPPSAPGRQAGLALPKSP